MVKQEPTQTIEAIPTESAEISIFTDTIQNSGLEKTKAERYALGYAPLMREVVEQSDLLKPLDRTKPEDEAQAKSYEEKQTAALRAPDKEKVRALFDQIKAITIPEFGTMEGQQLGQMVLGALKALQADIINESKKLL